MTVLSYVMVYAGSALMAFNIILYLRFAHSLLKRDSWGKESRIFFLPIVLLILFLAGYLAVGFFGEPNVIIASILFGGSIFVFVMLYLMRRAVDRIQENEHLKAKLSAAEEASRAKTFFLSNMSHDLRTPLNAIIGYTTIAKRDNVSPEERRSFLVKIDAASHQLLSIVNDVLEMGRIESGKMELNPARMDLKECMTDAGDLIHSQAEAKRIAFTASCTATDTWVMCDKNLLTRVLVNLLGNAVKFTGEGGKISLTLAETEKKADSASYEIRVKDTGIGMDPSFVEHLFTPFERERTSTISKIQGTGLGMAITKDIMDRMGGTIDVETEKGKGTEFILHLTFPLASAEEKDESASPEEMRFDGKRILLAEDNAVNREIAQMILTQAGFAVEDAENGKEVLEKLTAAGSGYYDLVLTDIQMPVMDGYTAARAIRSLPDPALRNIPIVAMTANAFAEDVVAARDSGMNAHISKPLDLKEMFSTLQNVLKVE